ncbi:MAG: hypothetical protein RSB91_09730 [Clostridia bacterium]
MRCGCPHCEAFMVQSETEAQACVCPDCGYRCNACLGTNTVVTREQLSTLKATNWFTPSFESPLSDEEASAEDEDTPAYERCRNDRYDEYGDEG